MASHMPPDGDTPNTAPPSSPSSNLKPVRMKGSVMAWATAGVVLSVLGLLLITGLSNTPWLFLLYPLLIGVLLASLGALALHLLHRF